MTEYAKLVVSVDSTQVGKAGAALNQLEKKSKSTEKSIGSLGSVVRSVAAPLAAFLSVRAIIRASDEYGQMASRIRNATTSVEEYETVQARLLQTANGTYRALSEAQEVYLSTADTLRDLGYVTSEVLDITDSFSYALVRDAARADQATAAMDAYSKALMKGKIDADAWASIMAATPSIVNGISEATGRSTEEIRRLGATGKLSVEALNEGLRRSREENKQLADAMETSVGDAVVNLQNQFGVFVGKVNEASGASGGLVSSIEELADILADPATVEAAQQLASGVVTAISAIAEATRATVGAVRWMGEEIAVMVNGIGLHDIDRLVEEASRLQGLLNKMEEDGDTGYAIYRSTQAKFDAVRKQLDSAYDLAELTASLQNKAGDQPQALQAQAGAVRGLVKAETEKIDALKQELEARKELTEQEKIRIAILRESGQLRAANDAQWELEYAEKIAEYERQGNQEALQRLETLRRIREVQMNADQAPGTVEGVSRAPVGGGLDAVVGGANSEIARLQREAVELSTWRMTELELQRGFLESKAIAEEEYAKRVANIHEQHAAGMRQLDQAKNLAILNGAADFFGNMAVLAQSENHKIAAIGKASAMAQATIQGALAIQMALASAPPPFNFALASAVGVATAANIATIAGVGFAEGGYTGPGGKHKPAGIVHAGEVVWSQDDIKRAGGVAVVEAMRRGSRGYADGGPVEMAPVRMATRPVSDHGSKQGQKAPVISVINNGPPMAVRQELDGDQIRLILDLAEDRVAGSMSGDGKLGKATQRVFGLRRASR